MSAKPEDAAAGHADSSRWHWPGGGADHRLAQSIGQLGAVLRASEPEAEAGRQAKRNALVSLRNARRELDRRWARNEEAWAWFHAARREEFRLRTRTDQEMLEINLNQEADEKLKSSWRLRAVEGYRNSNDDHLIERIIAVQRHLDETAENGNRKRMLQRRQVVIYLAVLATVFVLICVLEFLGRGLLLADGAVDGWWVVGAALYGTLGGAFSSAQRVAAARPGVRYPELRWRTRSGPWRAGQPPSSPSLRFRPTCSAERRRRADPGSPSSASPPGSVSASSHRSPPSRNRRPGHLSPSTSSARRR
jgi:hypothetical protein